MNPNFRDFQKHFKRYQERFGLNGYKIYFKHEPLPDSFADIMINQEGMVATVALNNRLSPRERPFADCHAQAKHEALHLLVGRLSDYAQTRYITKLDIREAEEELVRRLEKLIPDLKEVKK